MLDAATQTRLLDGLRRLSDALAAPDPADDLRHRVLGLLPPTVMDAYRAAIRRFIAPPTLPEGASDVVIEEAVEAAGPTRTWAKDVLRVLDAVQAERALLPEQRDTAPPVTVLPEVEERPFGWTDEDSAADREPGRGSFNGIYVDRNQRAVVVCTLRKPNASRHNDTSSVLLLDGTGNPDLVRRIFCPDKPEQVEHMDFPFDRVGRVIQTRGKGFSRTSLIGKRSARPDAPDINEKVAAEARRDRKSLRAIAAHDPANTFLTGSKALIEMLSNEDGGLPCRSNHYGANRGLNDYEGCAIGVAVGYEMPRLDALEDMRRAYSARDIEAFKPIEPDSQGKRSLVKAPMMRRMRDGSLSSVAVTVHPDPLCQAILEQVREAEVMQGIDRVRAVWQERTIILLNDLVLPLAIDSEVDAQHLLAGYDNRRGRRAAALEGHPQSPEKGDRREVAQEGLGRLWEPLQRLGGVLPLSPRMMADLFPAAWASEAAAKKWIARYVSPLRQADGVIEVADLAPVVPGQPVSGSVSLRFAPYRVGNGAGKERSGIALARIADPGARLRALSGATPPQSSV